MTYGFYLLSCLILVVVQTTIMPHIPVLNSLFSLPTAFVIYLGLFRKARESLPFVILSGLVTDHLSGAPFMLYITSLFWVYFGVRWLKGMLQVGMPFRLPMLVTAGIFIENLIHFVVIDLMTTYQQPVSKIVLAMLIQIVWAFFLGSFIVIGFKRMHQLWDIIVGVVLIKRADLAEREN
jgi:rod shape-determining protein MreD